MVRIFSLMCALFVSLFLAACGQSNDPEPIRPSTQNSTTVRFVTPVDENKDGVADSALPDTTTRLVIETDPSNEFSLSANGIAIPFNIEKIPTDDATNLVELRLERPLGIGTFVLRVNGQTLTFNTSKETKAVPNLVFSDLTQTALFDDVANPHFGVFSAPDNVVLSLNDTFPDLNTGDLYVQSAKSDRVPLVVERTDSEVSLRPERPLIAGRAYRVWTDREIKSASGQTLKVNFTLFAHHFEPDHCIDTVLADLNRDGKPELFSLYADGQVSMLTAPDATPLAILPPVEGSAMAIVTGDFDGDKAADLAVLDTNGVRILLNESRADESKYSFRSVASGVPAPMDLCVGDFNRDGRDEIFVLGAWGDVSAGDHQGVRWLGRVPTSTAMALHALSLDRNGDSRPDAMLVYADGSGRILQNQGESLALDRPQFVDCGAYNFADACDFDSDHANDVVLTGEPGAYFVLQDNESLTTRSNIMDTTLVSGAVIATDLNRDNLCDVLLAQEGSDGRTETLALFLQSQTPKTEPDSVFRIGKNVRVHALNFWMDTVVFATDEGLLLQDVNIAQVPPTANSSARFVDAWRPVPRIPTPLGATVADFNADGKADLAAIDKDGKLNVWLAGEEGEPFQLAGDGIDLGANGDLKAIDFDRDTFPDILFIPRDRSARPRVLKNRRDGSMKENDGFLPDPPADVRGAPAMGDFDWDGDLDVFWPSERGRVDLNDDGRWRDARTDLSVVAPNGRVLSFSGEVACADFTNDNKSDVAAVMTDGDSQWLVLFQGTANEDRLFTATVSTAISGRVFDLTPADLDGDGKVDLALGWTSGSTPPRLTLLRLDEDLQFKRFDGSPSPSGELVDLALDDIDCDGDLDLIAAEIVPEKGNQISLWVNDGHGRYVKGGKAQRSLRKALGGFQATNLSIADFTGNGRPDLLAIDAKGNVVLVQTDVP